MTRRFDVYRRNVTWIISKHVSRDGSLISRKLVALLFLDSHVSNGRAGSPTMMRPSSNLSMSRPTVDSLLEELNTAVPNGWVCQELEMKFKTRFAAKNEFVLFSSIYGNKTMFAARFSVKSGSTELRAQAEAKNCVLFVIERKKANFFYLIQKSYLILDKKWLKIAFQGMLSSYWKNVSWN